MGLNSIMKKINFKLILFHHNFSPFILSLVTTFLLTSHQSLHSPLILLTVHRRYPLSPATAVRHRWLPPLATTNYCQMPLSPSSTTVYRCRLPLSTPICIICCHYPLLPATTVHRRLPLSALTAAVADCQCSPLSTSSAAIAGYHRPPQVATICHCPLSPAINVCHY